MTNEHRGKGPELTAQEAVAFVRAGMSLTATLQEESDRGAVLVGAAAMDDALSRVLGANFVDDPRSVEAVFDAQGALGTFSAKIEIAFLFGLLGPGERRDLHLIRKIRNDFAHSPLTANFDLAAVAGRCQELKSCDWAVPEKRKSPRDRFLRAVAHLSSSVGGRALKTTHRSAAEDAAFIIDGANVMKMVGDLLEHAKVDSLAGKTRMEVYEAVMGPVIETIQEVIDQRSASSKSNPQQTEAHQDPGTGDCTKADEGAAQQSDGSAATDGPEEH